MEQGWIIGHKHHANIVEGNIINPIVDTWVHKIELLKSEETYLTANVVIKSTCAQRDVGGNEYLILDSIAHYRIFMSIHLKTNLFSSKTSLSLRDSLFDAIFLLMEGYFNIIGEIA